MRRIWFQAADFAAETLHKNLMSELQLNPTGGAAGAGGPQALDTAFLTTDSQMKLCVPQNCGTTAVAALLARKEVCDSRKSAVLRQKDFYEEWHLQTVFDV